MKVAAMVNYDELPLFPLHVVLYPDMPLPLHIFEPRYREMAIRCREENSPFGIVLIHGKEEIDGAAIPHLTGTTARITSFDEQDEGGIYLEVVGETRFRILQIAHHHSYLTAKVEPFWEQSADRLTLTAPFETASSLFRSYLKSLYALQGRALSALQLPQEPEYLSYAIASVLQIGLCEKQHLLELTRTQQRLQCEIEILQEETDAQSTLLAVQRTLRIGGDSILQPVDTQALGKLSSLN